MKQNIYRFKINYTFLGGASQVIQQLQYGDIVQITRDDVLINGIVYEINNENFSNSRMFVNQGESTIVGDVYTIITPEEDYQVSFLRQSIADNFLNLWWNNPNHLNHITNWDLTRPSNLQSPNLQPPPLAQ